MNTFKRNLVLLHLFLIFYSSTTMATWAMPFGVPIARLIANTQQYVDIHPDDPDGYYILGRVHGMAYVMKNRLGSAWGGSFQQKEDLPNPARHDQWGTWRKRSAIVVPPPTRQEIYRHLEQSILYYGQALELNSESALYQLGIAYILEVGAEVANQVSILPPIKDVQKRFSDSLVGEKLDELVNHSNPKSEQAQKWFHDNLNASVSYLYQRKNDIDSRVQIAVQSLLARHWRERAIVHYAEAYRLSKPIDSKLKEEPDPWLEFLTSYEAGQSCVRLIKSRGPRDNTEREFIADVKNHIEWLNDLPPYSYVTPIVFPMEENRSMESLLAADTTVRFDLDGDGVVENWPWVKPTTAILVWDPNNTGQIRSGRQLFGSATWWMFYSDGYRALDALDDDRNGRLEYSELTGISVWIDRDSDGYSDSGEVTPAKQFGIKWIATDWTMRVGESPANLQGLGFRDGRIVPTFDWITSSVSAIETQAEKTN